eukprot:TRINITY_DN809_c0_g1_i2.p2 TRINITY_DN809_c0_g1~~TRINITY_DN809_c0_g1_i2.p2  ORF type:complete len:107 (+),score=3.37 TRINITY_DN809_c0_g1_i2:526-846(+)
MRVFSLIANSNQLKANQRYANQHVKSCDLTQILITGESRLENANFKKKFEIANFSTNLPELSARSPVKSYDLTTILKINESSRLENANFKVLIVKLQIYQLKNLVL